MYDKLIKNQLGWAWNSQVNALLNEKPKHLLVLMACSYSSISVTFCNCCSNTFSRTRVSNLAKGAPTQKWIPELNATCALVSRLISNLSGSLKTVSSRLADPKQTIIFCPEEIIFPSMFTLSLTANLNIDWILPWPC